MDAPVIESCAETALPDRMVGLSAQLLRAGAVLFV